MKPKEKFELLDMKELNWLMNNPKLNWLRWVLVIPIALVGFGIVLLIEGVENWFYEPPTWLINYIQSPLFSFVCTLVFVMVGTEMAPHHKRTTGLILLLISVTIYGILTFIVFQTKMYIHLIYIIPGTIGSFAGYKIVESLYDFKDE